MQTVLPENYRADEAFQQNLRLLQTLGFSGVELNCLHPQHVDFAEVQQFLQTFDLEMTMFASGLTAKTRQLSLSSPDAAVRAGSVAFCRDMLERLTGIGAGIILGFLKGGPAPDAASARANFAASIREISPVAAERRVRILIEATNRYESAVANSLADAVALIEAEQNPYLRILPDTFHMNIEEADSWQAFTQFAGYYDSIHLSDNNRFLPGFGALKFAELATFLKRRDYRGGLALEGNLRQDFAADVQMSISYLTPFLKLTS